MRDWDPTVFFPPHRLKRLDRYAQFAVASARLALQDAGLAWSPEEPQARVGVSFGTALGGIANAESRSRKRLALNDFLWKSKLRTDFADFVLEELAQRLDELELHLLRQSADIVV